MRKSLDANCHWVHLDEAVLRFASQVCAKLRTAIRPGEHLAKELKAIGMSDGGVVARHQRPRRHEYVVFSDAQGRYPAIFR